MKKNMILFFLAMTVLTGCSKCIIIRSEYYDITGKVQAPKAAGQDIPIFTDQGNRPYVELGVVKVLAHWGTSREAINEELKKRARQAGADALVEVQYGEDTSNNLVLCGKILSTKRNMSAAGKAVIFVPLEIGNAKLDKLP